jgi:uncharacterized protein YebE (UPF0316 family)
MEYESGKGGKNMIMMLMIFCIQVVYVSLFTMRTIFTLKGQRYYAAGISIVEVSIYITGLTLVLNNLDDPKNLAAYCIGYALGILSGSKIEELLALGYVTVQIITEREDCGLAALLREKGFGVTSWYAEGKDASRLVLTVLAKRKYEKELFRIVEEANDKAFIISHEPKHFRGGFWVKQIQE